MTLDEVVSQLPSGLHDALLRTLTVDWVARRATLTLSVCVGDPEAPADDEREADRAVSLSFSGLLWCIIESPSNTESEIANELWIDAGPLSDLRKGQSSHLFRPTRLPGGSSSSNGTRSSTSPEGLLQSSRRNL